MRITGPCAYRLRPYFFHAHSPPLPHPSKLCPASSKSIGHSVFLHCFYFRLHRVNFRCIAARDRIREVAGSGRSFSLLNEKHFTAAIAAGALLESVLEHQPRPAGLAVSFRPGTRGPGGGSLSGSCVQSAPGRPLPSDPAHPPCSPLGLQNPGCVLTYPLPSWTLGEGGAGRQPSQSTVPPIRDRFHFCQTSVAWERKM